MQSIEVVLDYKGFKSTLDLWKLISSTHPEFNNHDVLNGSTGKSIKYAKVSAFLHRSKVNHFSIEFASNCWIEFGSIGGNKLDRLSVKNIVKNEADAEKWLCNILESDKFVSARLYDAEFEKWQNTTEPQVYEVHGRDYKNLPMKSNCLPPPLDHQVIDTSNNPGLRIIKNGYVEAVGSTMWLGESFFQFTGCDQQKLYDCDWLNPEKYSNYLKIQAMEEPFTCDTGNQRVLQKKMRKVLFGSN